MHIIDSQFCIMCTQKFLIWNYLIHKINFELFEFTLTAVLGHSDTDKVYIKQASSWYPSRNIFRFLLIFSFCVKISFLNKVNKETFCLQRGRPDKVSNKVTFTSNNQLCEKETLTFEEEKIYELKFSIWFPDQAKSSCY